jgi:hypothetical protein
MVLSSFRGRLTVVLEVVGFAAGICSCKAIKIKPLFYSISNYFGASETTFNR